jgi:hypothetical protein
MNAHLDAIRDPATSDADLAHHLAALGGGPAAEPPSFWNDIAGDARYRPHHRALAIVELFQRHLPPGAPLAVLAGARWLDLSSLAVIDAVAGKLPVPYDLADTILVARVSADLASEIMALYLRIAGRWTRGELAAALSSPSPTQTVRAWAILDGGGAILARAV